jgi:hypothetical protein
VQRHHLVGAVHELTRRQVAAPCDEQQVELVLVGCVHGDVLLREGDEAAVEQLAD